MTRWCSHCERELPVAAFYLLGRGDLRDSRCKLCSRWSARESYRRRAKNPGYRLAEAARRRESYPRERARILAYQQTERARELRRAAQQRRRAA